MKIDILLIPNTPIYHLNSEVAVRAVGRFWLPDHGYRVGLTKLTTDHRYVKRFIFCSFHFEMTF